MKAALYNPYLDTLGGGERYVAGVIQAFEKAGYRVDLEWESAEMIKKLQERFGVKFQQTKVVGSINRGDGYDACFWVSDGSVPTLRSRNNILHFQVPFVGVSGRTLINKMKFIRIKHVVVNSNFTKGFIDREYGVYSKVIYPPVSVIDFRPRRKQNIICYVGRFSKLTQSKRQDVLVEVFKKFSKEVKGWKLVLAGGVEVGNDDFTEELRNKAKGYPVEILESPKLSEIKELLGTSKMFWSAAGYGIDEQMIPSKVEHFGISVVEAMAAKVAPLVHNKGGYKEIIDDGKTGYLWTKKGELLKNAEFLANNFDNLRLISKNASEASLRFSKATFEQSFIELLK